MRFSLAAAAVVLFICYGYHVKRQDSIDPDSRELAMPNPELVRLHQQLCEDEMLSDAGFVD